MDELSYDELLRERDSYREKFLNEIKLRKHTFEIINSFFNLQFRLCNNFFSLEYLQAKKDEKKDLKEEILKSLQKLFTAKDNFEEKYSELDDNLRRLQLL